MEAHQSNTLELQWNKENPAYYTVLVSGRLDLLESQHLENEISSCIKQEPRNLGIDMQGVHFMSSSGIRSLVAIRRLMEDQNKKLALYALPPSVTKVLQIVEIDHLFTICQHESEALKLLQ